MDAHLDSATEAIKDTNKISTEPELINTTIEGETYYCITNFDLMQPFFMNIVSDNDLWMFISSNGGLSAGRVNPDKAIFPYYTDDKITSLATETGSVTHIKIIDKNGNAGIWSPLRVNIHTDERVTRNIYKSTLNNKLVFEEVHEEYQLVFRYGWYFSNKYGLVRKASVENIGNQVAEIELLDGIQNILPSNVSERLQNWRSNLVNAYRKNELITNPNMGIYSLSSRIIDKPMPSESLSATVAWSFGIEHAIPLLSSKQIPDFVQLKTTFEETDIRSEAGAWLQNFKLQLSPGQKEEWGMVVETKQGAEDIVNLQKHINDSPSIQSLIEEDILEGNNNLINLLKSSDGLQNSNDDLSAARHLSNVLFNILRGGVFISENNIQVADFLSYLENHNAALYKEHRHLFNELPDFISRELLIQIGRQDVSLLRHSMEYLPLYFSRRHGDPSRPWNGFNIHTQSESGDRVLDYEGNWRDIFQNWEALAMSFPGFLESMIARFLNASTADGYNPYRINRRGIDWETIDIHDPWSFIGYWGDHQIIYLLKFLELSEQYFPGRLSEQINDSVYAFANVPYRIRVFDDILKDPQNTIRFDEIEEDIIEERVEHVGADGKLLWNREGVIIHATLAEKLLIPILAKLSNYIHEGGIWLNTQRPEWNDANNALVGNGISMVTLHYIRRYLKFIKPLFSKSVRINVSAEVKGWMEELNSIFVKYLPSIQMQEDHATRFKMIVDLGHAAQHYNQQVYAGLSGYTAELRSVKVIEFIEVVLQFVDHTINVNNREDKLSHAYNILVINKEGTAQVDHMYLMLEGQVSALSSGVMKPNQAVELLDALKESNLFRADHYSYLLYPDRQLPTFMQKNLITNSKNLPAIFKTLASNPKNKIVNSDDNGNYHFHKDISNADELLDRIKTLQERIGIVISSDEESELLKHFEQVFNHDRFTGRSGTFYGYEGLNSIYWHMVSKLLLAVQEQIKKGQKEKYDKPVIDKLIDHYYEIRAGIGLNKKPDLFGAFPTDPYSHTPGHRGAQQPGMTGQVKEDIISRFGELGVSVQNGCINFSGSLLRRSEFIDDSSVGKPYISFTYCSIPIIYYLAETNESSAVTTSTEKIEFKGLTLSRDLSRLVFDRNHNIQQIEVYIKPELD